MPAGKTKFQKSWLTRELNGVAVKEWCSSTRDTYVAHCDLCNDNFIISNSGFSQLKSHHNGKKHKEKFNARFSGNSLVKLFCLQKESDGNSELKSLPPLNNELQVIKAEALWCLNVAHSNFSFKSCNGTIDIFKAMFSDSKIAAQMQLKEKKVAYIISHGLAVHFNDELKRDIKESKNPITIAFDETTNSQIKKQLDIYVRYWSEEKNKIACRYLTSVFLGHATADIVIKELLDVFSASNIGLNNLLTISMDGPNVNKSILKKLNDLVVEETGHKLMEGSFCCLHVVHNSFNKMLKKFDFNLDELASDLYSFLKDSAARREDFKEVGKITDVLTKFMVKHVSSRWTTIGPVAERIFEQLPNLKEYFLNFLPKQQKNIDDNERYRRIRKALKNKVLPCYLTFVINIHPLFEKFLIPFQSEAPLIHRLYFEINELLRNVMSKFIQASVVLNKEGEDLKVIDLSSVSNFKPLKELEIGMTAYRLIRDLDESDKKSFLLNIRAALIVNVEYLKEKLPFCNNKLKDFQVLKQKRQSEVCHANSGLHLITRICQYLHFPDNIIDLVRSEWKFYQLQILTEDFWDNKKILEDVDVYWANIFKIKQDDGSFKFLNLSKVVKAALALPHGNADPERGFSLNNTLVTTDKSNLNDSTIKAMHVVKSAIHYYGGNVMDVPITLPLLKNVSNAHRHFKEEVERLKDVELQLKKKDLENKKQKQDTEELKKRKLEWNDTISAYDIEIGELENHKQTSMAMIKEGTERMAKCTLVKAKNSTTEMAISQKLICQGTESLSELENKLKSLRNKKDNVMKKRFKV